MAGGMWASPYSTCHIPPAFQRFSGDHTGGVTPVPIPNTVVKPSRAHGTARVTAWESRSSPGLNSQNASASCWGVFVFAALGGTHYEHCVEWDQGRAKSATLGATLGSAGGWRVYTETCGKIPKNSPEMLWS